MRAQLKPHTSSAKMDYETPASIFDPLHAEFDFNIDLAASAGNAKCGFYYDEAVDSLKQSWRAIPGQTSLRGWLNPPYGRRLKNWVRKAYEDTRQHGSLIVMLIPARTDTHFWHDYVMKAEEIRYLRGRIKFVGCANGALFPSAVVIFGASHASRKMSKSA